jgi:hypothetical protein
MAQKYERDIGKFGESYFSQHYFMANNCTFKFGYIGKFVRRDLVT